MVLHSSPKHSPIRQLAVLAVAVLVLGSTLCQQAQAPSLVSNQKLTDYLNTKVLPTTCVNKGFENALSDINARASLSYVIRTRTIPNSSASQESSDQLVIDALTAAVQTPDEVAAKVLTPDNWSDSAVIKNTQHFIYAISDGTNVSYYELQFDLNYESAIKVQAEYIGAMVFLACQNQKEWIQHYFAPPTPPAVGAAAF